jgi:hypothetical protein
MTKFTDNILYLLSHYSYKLDLRSIIKLQKNLIICLITLLSLSSCANIDLSLGKVSFNSNINKNAFIFLVSDEYLRLNSHSKIDKNYPKMTKAEADLLIAILKKNQHCLNKNGQPSFIITSKQEKVYDTTFLSLIEQNYNARPIVLATYFGKCIEEN